MTTSAICRACLSSSHELYCIADTGLQVKFEALTRIQLKSKDGRSEKLCYICCALLQKFYNFVFLAQSSDRVFTVFHARNILVSRNTVSKLNLKKHNFCFSRLKSVCIDVSPKTLVPAPDIKKEVIEINKNTFAEVVQMSDIIKDFENYSVENDLMLGQNIMSDDSIKMEHSYVQDHIVSGPSMKLEHISEKNQNSVSDTSVNLEHSPAVTSLIHPHQIKQEIIEIDNNNDVVIIDDNDILNNFENRLVKNEPEIIKNRNSNTPTTAMIHPHEIKQEIIEIDKNNDVVIIDDNDILNSFENNSLKKEPEIIINPISNNSMNLELSSADTTVIHPHEIKQEIIETDTNNDVEMLNVNDIFNKYKNQSVKNEPMLIENRIANASVNLEHSPTTTIIHPQRIKPEVIEIDNNTYEEVFETTDGVEKVENHEKNHSDSSVNLEHLPVVPIVRRPNRIKQKVAEININTFAKKLETTKDFKNHSSKETHASVYSKNSPVIATVRHPHKLKQEIIEIDKNIYAEMLEMTDILENFETRTVKEPIVEKNQITDTSVNLEHVPEISTLRKQHIPLIGTISYPHRTGRTSSNFERSPSISTMRHQDKNSDTLLNSEHLPVDTIMGHPHRVKQKVTRINNKTFAKQLEMIKDFGNLKENNSVKPVVSTVKHEDTLANSEPTQTDTFRHQHTASGNSMILEHIPVSFAKKSPDRVRDTTVNLGQFSVRHEPKLNDVSVNLKHSPVIAVVRHPHKRKQEAIKINKDTYAEMLEMTDLVENFANHSVNRQPVIEQSYITATTVNLEHSPAVATVRHSYGVSDTSRNNTHSPVISALRNRHTVSDTSISLEHTPAVATDIQPHRIQQEVIENYENNLEMHDMNGILKDFGNHLVNRHPKMVNNHISDTSLNSEHTPVISTLRNQHNANDTSINLKHSQDISTKRHKHRTRDYSKSSERSSLKHRHGAGDTSNNWKRSPVSSTMRHRYKGRDHSTNLKRSREPSIDRQHRSRDDLKRSSLRQHRVNDTSKYLKRSRESSNERRRQRTSYDAKTLERSSLTHHHRANDTSKNWKRSPLRFTERHRHRNSDDSMNLEHSSLRHQQRTNDTSVSLNRSLVISTDRHPRKTSETSVNLEHTPLRHQHRASDTSVNIKRSPIISTEIHLQTNSDTLVNLEQTHVNSTSRNHHTISDTSVNLNHSLVASTEKHTLRASDASVNLKQTPENSTLNYHIVSDTSVNLNHSVVPIVKHTQKDDELIHPGLSPVSSDEDDDLFIQNHKDPPIPSLMDEYDLPECSENEKTSLMIDDKESDSLEQLEQRLIKEQLILEQLFKDEEEIKEQLVLEQLFKDEEDLLNETATAKEEKPSIDQSDTSGSPHCDKHEASACCQEHAYIRSDNARLRPCDYGLHQAADECIVPDAAFVPFGSRTQKFDNSSSSSEDEKPSANKRKCESPLQHCKGSQCYSCNDCYKTYKNRRNLYNHIKRKHPGMQILGCHKCDIIITSNTDFINHYKLSHPREKYPCNKCKMKFTTANCLMVHKSNDHGTKMEPIYKCDTCDKSFNERLDFKYHVLFVHPPKINKYSELF